MSDHDRALAAAKEALLYRGTYDDRDLRSLRTYDDRDLRSLRTGLGDE